MKRMFSMLLTLMLIFYCSTAAYAGGAGPSKDMLKGVFTEVSPAERTALFMKDDAETARSLMMGETLEAADIPVGNRYENSRSTGRLSATSTNAPFDPSSSPCTCAWLMIRVRPTLSYPLKKGP